MTDYTLIKRPVSDIKRTLELTRLRIADKMDDHANIYRWETILSKGEENDDATSGNM